MQFPIEKYVSNFIPSNIPPLYDEEGSDITLFFQTYYEWLESQNDPTTGRPNAIGAARNLMDYRDIDNTLDEFLVYFQKKYLYGIPFNVIINKRFLLKHVQDVYRSKGTIQGYKLLFKLIYNQDIEVYLPRNDILKPSDGTWKQPLYVEVSDNGNLASLVGQTIVGLNSGVVAVVEDFVREKIKNGIICTLYLSNLSPPSSTFIQGESIIIQGTTDSNTIFNAPTILGSLETIDITNGGVNFKVGDILKITDRNLTTNLPSSFGFDGLVKVTSLTSTKGNIIFQINDGGFGYLVNSDTFFYNTGNNAINKPSFLIDSITYQEVISYNTDLLCNYLTMNLSSTTYGFPGNTSANLTTPFNQYLSYSNGTFGTIAYLDVLNVGNNIINTPNVFVFSTMKSANLSGNVSFASNSNIVTGNGTTFTNFVTANSVIVLYANSTVSEKQVVLSVANDTSLTLYGNATYTNTASKYCVAPSILPSNFTIYDPVMQNEDGSISGLNANIVGIPSFGNNNAGTVKVINSGRGYIDGESVSAYLYNSLKPITIMNGGRNYANGETINFIGTFSSPLSGYVTTNANGTITAVTHDTGSNIQSVPNITINTKNGTGAVLSTSIMEFDNQRSIQGTVAKSGMGKSPGYWTTTRGFLNSDKYIQDDYFYQDFSYQIRAEATLQNYKNIIYNSFHPSGSEMFGQYYSIDSITTSDSSILAEGTYSLNTSGNFFSEIIPPLLS